MWDQGNNMFGAPSASESKPKKNKKLAYPFHLKRATGQIRNNASEISGGTSITGSARIMLNDFTPISVDLFTNVKFPYHEEVSLTMEAPTRFFQKAKVVRCEQMIPNTKIVSETAFKYRMTIKFIFDSSDQEKAVLSFVNEIRDKHLKVDLPEAA